MTEYGADTLPGLHDIFPGPWTEEYQVEVLEMSHRVFDRVGAVVGEHAVELRRLRHRARDHAGRREQEGCLHPRAQPEGGRALSPPTLAAAHVIEDARGGEAPPSQYLGYAGGEVANNLTFSMVSAFLLIYYTDVAGISAATAGTLFLVVRIWGGVTDLLAGRRVDATSTRWGRFRPYLLFGSIPLLVLLVAVFSIPSGLSDDAQDRLGSRLLCAVPARL